MGNHTSVVIELAVAGIDLEVTNSKLQTGLDIAAQSDKANTAVALIEYGAKVKFSFDSIANEEVRSFLQLALLGREVRVQYTKQQHEKANGKQGATQQEGYAIELRKRSIETLPDCLRRYSNITSLSIEDNALTSLNGIHTMSLLTYLNASNNRINSIPKDFCQLAKLQEVHLSQNSISELPLEIGRLKNLSCLRIANNKLQSIPHSIGQLLDLGELDVSHNQINDLPYQIGLLKDLLLHTAGNPLKSFPREFDIKPGQSVADHSAQILGYMRAMATSGEEICYRVKLMVVCVWVLADFYTWQIPLSAIFWKERKISFFFFFLFFSVLVVSLGH